MATALFEAPMLHMAVAEWEAFKPRPPHPAPHARPAKASQPVITCPPPAAWRIGVITTNLAGNDVPNSESSKLDRVVRVIRGLSAPPPLVCVVGHDELGTRHSKAYLQARSLRRAGLVRRVLLTRLKGNPNVPIHASGPGTPINPFPKTPADEVLNRSVEVFVVPASKVLQCLQENAARASDCVSAGGDQRECWRKFAPSQCGTPTQQDCKDQCLLMTAQCLSYGGDERTACRITDCNNPDCALVF